MVIVKMNAFLHLTFARDDSPSTAKNHGYRGNENQEARAATGGNQDQLRARDGHASVYIGATSDAA